MYVCMHIYEIMAGQSYKCHPAHSRLVANGHVTSHVPWRQFMLMTLLFTLLQYGEHVARHSLEVESLNRFCSLFVRLCVCVVCYRQAGACITFVLT